MKICIDAGHGGSDPGADGPTGLHEAPTILTVSKYVCEELEEKGISTLLTRKEEVYVGLGTRCEIANDWGASYFISIHMNSNGPTAVGIETLYKTETGKALATPIQKKLLEATGDVDRGLKHRNDLYVLNGTYMPAVLVEVGFVSHPETEAKFKSDNHLRIVAKAIADGIIEFLPKTPSKL
jgi:N-acetylmuramoyl-L-alanine amidase